MPDHAVNGEVQPLGSECDDDSSQHATLGMHEGPPAFKVWSIKWNPQHCDLRLLLPDAIVGQQNRL